MTPRSSRTALALAALATLSSGILSVAARAADGPSSGPPQGPTTEEVTHSVAIPYRPTGIERRVRVPAFDAAAGQLVSVTLRLDLEIEGSVAFENLAERDVIVTTVFATGIELRNAAGTPLVAGLPGTSNAVILEAFDGVLDMQGPSAYHSPGLALPFSREESSTTGLAPFTGDAGEEIALEFAAENLSSSTSGKPLAARCVQLAGGKLYVTYEYLPDGVAGSAGGGLGAGE